MYCNCNRFVWYENHEWGESEIRHKCKTRKGWIKAHFAVDVKRKRFLALEITNERTSDQD